MLNDLLNLFYPQYCPACEQPLLRGEEHICTKCRLHLPYTCYEGYRGNPLTKSFFGLAPVAEATALCHFRSGSRIQRLLHDPKYNGNKELAHHMGLMLGQTLLQSDRFQDIQSVVPVPLHPKKLRLRGYNQAEAIGRGVASSMGVDLADDVLVRKTNNRSQTSMSRFNRWQAIRSSFAVKKHPGVDNILIIDDVITTGATIGVCADLIHRNLKDTEVFVAAIACA